jgi:hypothetical protein
MGFSSEIALRMGMYKNRVKINRLLATGRWKTYYLPLASETTVELPKKTKKEKGSPLPIVLNLTTKPYFAEVGKMYEYHCIEGKPGTIDLSSYTGSAEDKEERRLITQAIEAGERIEKANRSERDLFGMFKEYANLVPIIILMLQIAILAGIYVIMNP